MTDGAIIGHPVLVSDLATLRVLGDVVQVDVDFGRVLAGDPIGRRCLEVDIDAVLAGNHIATDQLTERVTDILDHTVEC